MVNVFDDDSQEAFPQGSSLIGERTRDADRHGRFERVPSYESEQIVRENWF